MLCLTASCWAVSQLRTVAGGSRPVITGISSARHSRIAASLASCRLLRRRSPLSIFEIVDSLSGGSISRPSCAWVSRFRIRKLLILLGKTISPLTRIRCAMSAKLQSSLLSSRCTADGKAYGWLCRSDKRAHSAATPLPQEGPPARLKLSRSGFVGGSCGDGEDTSRAGGPEHGPRSCPRSARGRRQGRPVSMSNRVCGHPASTSSSGGVCDRWPPLVVRRGNGREQGVSAAANPLRRSLQAVSEPQEFAFEQSAAVGAGVSGAALRPCAISAGLREDDLWAVAKHGLLGGCADRAMTAAAAGSLPTALPYRRTASNSCWKPCDIIDRDD